MKYTDVISDLAINRQAKKLEDFADEKAASGYDLSLSDIHQLQGLLIESKAALCGRWCECGYERCLHANKTHCDLGAYRCVRCGQADQIDDILLSLERMKNGAEKVRE